MKPIFCGNFEYDARQSELERLFARYGKVDRVDMKSGYAFIYMEDERDAEDAIRALDRREFGRQGRRLRVEWTKQERGIRRPGGGGSRRSSNNRPSKTLFVINFDPHHTRTKDLERHFDSYGKIVSVRIRRNFGFVQYELQEDATKALEATNMSKLMDMVISVEYSVRDDEERRDSPERNRDRSPGRGRDRRRSPSPYRRERGSPDYGRGSSPGAHRRERGSPDYGRGRSLSPYRKDRGNSDYGRGRSRSRSPSPQRREMAGPDHDRGSSHSPNQRDKVSADRSASPYRRKRSSPANGHDPSRSPVGRDRTSLDNGRGQSPSSAPEPRDSPNDDGPESPMNDRYRSGSPPAEE